MSASRKSRKNTRSDRIDADGRKVRQICPVDAIISPSRKEVSPCWSWRLAASVKAA